MCVCVSMYVYIVLSSWKGIYVPRCGEMTNPLHDPKRNRPGDQQCISQGRLQDADLVAIFLFSTDWNCRGTARHGKTIPNDLPQKLSETHPLGGVDSSLGSPGHLAHVLRRRHEEDQVHAALGHGVVLPQEVVQHLGGCPLPLKPGRNL